MADEETKTPLEIADERIKELEDNSQGALEGLSDKVSSGFWNKIKEFFMVFFALQYSGVGSSMFKAAEAIKQSGIDTYQPFLDENVGDKIKELKFGDVDPEAVLEQMHQVVKDYPILGVVLNFFYILMVSSGMIKSSLAAAWEQSTQVVYSAKRPSVLDASTAVDAWWKDPTFSSQMKEILNRLGIPDNYQEMMLKSSETVLDPTMLRDALLRGIISESEHDNQVRKSHLNDSNIGLMKELYKVIPPIQDIITMAVREVFTPDIVSKFGQMEGMPDEFAEWAATKGLDPFWTRAYWAAHWMLPSIGQGFEMLQRRVIDESELDMLLKAADVMPFWRDKLTQISYMPLTRVDVRRMHQIGVLDEEGVFNSYLDVGYNEDNARLMTEFTVAYNQQTETDLTKGEILDLFKKNALDFDTAQSMLISLGKSEDSSVLLLYRASTEVYAEQKKKQVGYIEKAFIAGKISESEAIGELGKMDLSSGEINYYVNTWNIAKANKVRNLTVEQIKQFYVADVITVGEAQVELQELGYNDADTNRFIAFFNKGKTV